jgi:hypothetical protein
MESLKLPSHPGLKHGTLAPGGGGGPLPPRGFVFFSHLNYGKRGGRGVVGEKSVKERVNRCVGRTKKKKKKKQRKRKHN